MHIQVNIHLRGKVRDNDDEYLAAIIETTPGRLNLAINEI